MKLNQSESVGHLQKLTIELKKFASFEELTPEMLHRLIKKIEIVQKGRVKIFYRFSLPAA
ncbi:DUF4368 domain-containing protein [Metabacillus sp. RGM 3146]|uniref:DUF4368 domain-containing protein n=1 Tax=Metabacillus sp. RGM 3146 TaxID=3401092 RepID=UPI003B9CC17C